MIRIIISVDDRSDNHEDGLVNRFPYACLQPKEVRSWDKTRASHISLSPLICFFVFPASWLGRRENSNSRTNEWLKEWDLCTELDVVDQKSGVRMNSPTTWPTLLLCTDPDGHLTCSLHCIYTPIRSFVVKLVRRLACQEDYSAMPQCVSNSVYISLVFVCL